MPSSPRSFGVHRRAFTRHFYRPRLEGLEDRTLLSSGADQLFVAEV